MLNILHVSDLHFTNASGAAKDASHSAVVGILSLAEELKKHGTLSKDVAVCITGDLVHSGEIRGDNSSDFNSVDKEFLQPLQEILNISSRQIYIVPGNHELDRQAIAEENRISLQDTFSIDALYSDLTQKLSAYYDFIDERKYSSVTREKPRLAIFEHNGIDIICFNALAGAYSKSGTGDKGNLFIAPTEIGALFSNIPKHALFLMHHPFSWFSDESGVQLKELLSSRHCRLMTGHIHNQGADWIETENGTVALMQAGVIAEKGDRSEVSVAWLPASQSAAVRHYSFNNKRGQFDITPVQKTRCLPKKSDDFFKRSEAYFDPIEITDARLLERTKAAEELKASFGRPPNEYVTPDLVVYSADQFSALRTNISHFLNDNNNRVVSGEELSGKSSFIAYCSYEENKNSKNNKINILLDYRAFIDKRSVKELIIRELAHCNIDNKRALHVLQTGLVELWIDNFDPEDQDILNKFVLFTKEYPQVRWTLAARGRQQFLPSRAPADFPDDGITYYELSEITLPTALKMIDLHENGNSIEKPRAVVERVFRSVNNLRAPRTIFYVDSLINMFLSDASVEPLNRYLLIENLLSEKIREAHKNIIPHQAVDMEMLETFIGLVSHYLLKNQKNYLSKADYYILAENFIQKKGLQKKRFDPDLILRTLTESFVLREYEDGYSFMMLSIEDYFLAKHMGKDEDFRSHVMSTDGLLTLPNVAEYYIAQNPSDKNRIEQIFDIIEGFENEVWPVLETVSEFTFESIRQAKPGKPSLIQDELINELGEVENARDEVMVLSEKPDRIGNTERLRFSTEERGAVYLQLGASILGVTRTLDQSDRIEIFKRLRKILLISINGVPVIAEHLSRGGELQLRGVSIRADYVGALAVQENRFYLLMRGMLYNVFKSFATWAGSPSFFNAAVKLRDEEDDELIKAALFAQNIEADLSEAVAFISDVEEQIESTVLKESVMKLFVDAMMLVPLERGEQTKALEDLVEATLALNPPKNDSQSKTLNIQKNRIRQDLMNKLGLNQYIGKLVKPSKK